MNYSFIILTGVALSLDTFAISTIIGATTKKITQKEYFLPLIFGFFHAIMLITGFTISTTFHKYINTFDHWIAFGILIIIGTKMIVEGKNKKKQKTFKWTNWKNIITISAGTSIDALALGITFQILEQGLIIPTIIIAIIVFLFGIGGLEFGSKIKKFKPKETYTYGGIALIIIGIKILLEHII